MCVDANCLLTCPSDDKVEEGHLSSTFDITCLTWQVGGSFHHRDGRSDVHGSNGLVSPICTVVVRCRSAFVPFS